MMKTYSMNIKNDLKEKKRIYMDKIIEDYIEKIQLSMKLNFDKHLKKKRKKYP